MICGLLIHTRQGYFKHLKALPAKQLHDEIAVSKVITIRQTQTKTGGRKLKIMMFNDDGFVIGRDHCIFRSEKPPCPIKLSQCSTIIEPYYIVFLSHTILSF